MGRGTASEVEHRVVAPETASVAAPAATTLARAFPTLPTFASRRTLALRLSRNLTLASASFATAWQSERDHGTPFLFVPVVLGAGVWAWYTLPRDVPPLLLAALLAASATLAVWSRHRSGFLAVAARAAFLFVAGMTLAAVETARLSTAIFDQPVTTTITGRVLSGEADERGRMRYRVAVIATREPALRRPPDVVNLVARSPHAPIAVGAGISGRARLSPPSGAALPGLNDFAFDAYFAGTGAIGYFYGKPAAVVLSEAASDVSWLAHARETVAAWRGALTARIRDQIGGDAGAIAAALVTAEQRGISPDTVEALRRAGLAHVLAISGLNMVLAAGTFLVGARLALSLLPGAAERYPIKKFAAAGGLVTVTLYILISGGAVSAVRSWLMIVVMLVAVLFDRTAISLRNIALSAIVLLAVTPSAVTGPGFQMSYAATLGLVAGYAAWRDRRVSRTAPSARGLRLMQHASGFTVGLLLSSVIGGLATLVYSLGHFHRIPAYGLAGNLLAMPVISFVVMPMGVIAMLLMPLGFEGLPLAIMGKGIEAMIVMANWVSGWGGEIVTGRLSPLAFALLAAGGGLACLFRTRLAALAVLPLAAGVAVAALAPARPPPQLLVSEDGALVALVDGRTAATNRRRPPGFIYDQWRYALRIEDHVAPSMLDGGEGDREGPARPTAKRRGGAAGRADDGRATPSHAALPRPVASSVSQGTGAHRAETGLAKEALDAAFILAAGQKRFVCRRQAWCVGVTAADWRVVWLEDPAHLGAACDSADIVVAPRHRREGGCTSGARLISAHSLRLTGALEMAPADDAAATGRRIITTQAVVQLYRPWNRHRLYDWRTDSFRDDRFQDPEDDAEAQ
ncbi:ComEC/Rec2 family competence protein [Rhizobium sp. GN54]|uniref:ComEC/Rec2 family competence protein n=1 Tax=Rhizobium sp. GN54 TaxID=2898150 RepID=UPI001E4FADC7|nr:ComEC/Rec2 family competence protein [Rhizobium sp. GN54]MCD2185279.1 ComEC family competence protein [Rhizobium sp. GN54]